LKIIGNHDFKPAPHIEIEMTMKHIRTIAAFFVLAASLFASTAYAQTFNIRAGDLLRVEVLEDSSINREVLVAPDGRISMPLAGNVRVSGVSLVEAQRILTNRMESNFATRPTVLVSLIQLREPAAPAPQADPDLMSVYVIGEVNNPGLIETENRITMLQALSLAGGMTDFAAVKRVQLRRVVNGSEKVYGLNYQQILDGQSGVGLTSIADGDVIVVPARRLFE
tara:strand:+ start:66794 stop:67465 length:672 start_codon:yes stop_codon:yes gene_type:complete